MTTRIAILLTLLVAGSARLHGQGIVGGRLLESESKRPLGCVTVALLDSASRPVGSTQSRIDGSFELAAPSKGAYRWRFSAFGLRPAETPSALFDEATDSERDYLIALEPVDSLIALMRASHGDSVPQLDPRTRPRMPPFPKSLVDRGITSAQAIVAYVVDERGRSDSATAFRIFATAPEIFDNVLSLVQTQRYRPARQDGAAVCRFVVAPFGVEQQTRSIVVPP